MIQNAIDDWRSAAEGIVEEVERTIKHNLEFKYEMAEMAGITIMNESGIKETLIKRGHEILEGIESKLYFRKDLIIRYHPDIELDDFGENLLSIKSVFSNDDIKLIGEIYIHEEPGEVSEFIISAAFDGQVNEKYVIRFENGKARWDAFEGFYVAERDAQIIDEGHEEFYEVIDNLIAENFPRPWESIRYLEYEVKDGGDPPVADFPCEECGEFGVSTNLELCELGQCAFCGQKHDLIECTRCGKYCNGNDTGEFCDECNVYFTDYY